MLCRLVHSGMALDRIAIDHRTMGGVPCIGGRRIPVTMVVGMIAEGLTTVELLTAFDSSQRTMLRNALNFAAAAADEHEPPIRTAR